MSLFSEMTLEDLQAFARRDETSAKGDLLAIKAVCNDTELQCSTKSLTIYVKISSVQTYIFLSPGSAVLQISKDVDSEHQILLRDPNQTN